MKKPSLLIILNLLLITLLFQAFTLKSNAQPVADFTYAFTNNGCSPDTVVFTNTSTEAVSYLWDFGDFSIPVSVTDTSHWYPDGMYYVTLIAYDGLGDSSITTQAINISLTPYPGWAGFTTSPNPACIGTEVDFKINMSPLPTSVIWDFGDSYGSALFNPSHLYASTGTYNIILIAFNECGSDVAMSPSFPPVIVNSTIVPIPVFSASPTVACIGEPVTFENFTSPTPSGTLWTFGDGDFSTSHNSVHSYSDTGDYKVFLNASNACGSAIDSITILIDDNIIPSISITASSNLICPDGIVDFTTYGGNLKGFSWDFDDGSFSLQQNPSHAFADTGTFNVIVTATNSCGYADSDSIIIVVDTGTAPYPGFSYNPFSFCPYFSNICPGTEVGFSNNSMYASGSYWDFGDGDTSTMTNPTHVFTDTGAYIVQLIVTSPCGGKDSIERCLLVVNDVTPTVNFCYNSACSPYPVCPGTPVIFNNQSSDTTNCSWDFGDGDTSATANPTHIFADTGLYTVILQVTNACGNVDYKYEIINISYGVGPPKADISTLPAFACPGEPISFLIDGTDIDTSNVSWDFGDGNTSTLPQPTHFYNSGGNYPVTLVIYTSCGNDTVIKDVAVKPGALPDFTYLAGCAGGDTTFFYDASSPVPDSWAWDINGDTSTIQNPIHVFASPGDYYVSLTVSKSSCVSSVTQQLSIGMPVTANITGLNSVSCYGLCDGSATLTASGGIAPYNYLWDDPLSQTGSTAYLCTGSFSVIITDVNGCTNTSNVTITGPPAILLTLNSVDAACDSSDGMAIVSASGGVPPYLYLWDDTATQTTDFVTGLSAGVYTVIVTDSILCSDTGIVIVNNTGAATISISYTSDVTCNGYSNGVTAVSASGGTAPYTYQWDDIGTQTADTANGLIAGTYTVTVTDSNGCVSFAIAVINEPPELITGITGSSNISCYGLCDGSASLTASGGTPPYTYLWSDPGAQTDSTATGLCQGIYSVTVTDANGCTDTSNITLTQPPPLTSGITDSTNINCNGSCDGTATVTPAGGTSPYTYAWNTTPPQSGSISTDLCAGVLYTVIVTDNNTCVDSSNVMLTEPSTSMAASIIDSSNASCYGICDGSATITTSGGTPPYTFIWNTVPQQSGSNATGLCAGAYNVIISDANECDTTLSNIISQPPAILLSLNSADILCNNICDGSATVSVSGGTAPFTYLWNTTPSQTDTTATGLCPGTYQITVTDTMGCNATDSVSFSNPPELTSYISDSTNISCYGVCDGDAMVTPGGGTPFYSYYWNTSPPQYGPNAIGVCAGTYSVIVTDAYGCTDTSNVTLSEPLSISIILDSIPDTCGNAVGQASVIASSGVSPYTYLWNDPSSQTNDIATGLIAETYDVTVMDADGCTVSGQITVTDAGSPAISVFSTTDVICYGVSNGAIDITVSGGTPGYAYSWTGPNGFTSNSENISGLEAGTYDITVTDSIGCIGTASAIIIEPPELTSSITASTNASCYGFCDGTATGSANGGTPPYAYQWNDPNSQTDPVATGLCNGIYIVTITDSNTCTDTSSVIITEPGSIIIESTVDTATQGINDGIITLTVTGGTAPYFYLWNDPNAQTGSIATGLFAGTYTVIVTDNNGCIDSASIEVPEVTGIETLTGFKTLSGLRIYPNPTEGLITFVHENPQGFINPEGLRIVQIYNILGEKIYSKSLDNIRKAKPQWKNNLQGSYEIDLGELPNGIYLIKFVLSDTITLGNNSYLSRRIIIAK
ncbi:MAG: PKD domain-containing protein [Bacteroidota bacterium]